MGGVIVGEGLVPSRGSTQGAPLHFLPTVSVGAAIGRPPKAPPRTSSVIASQCAHWRGNPFPLPPTGRRKATLCKNYGLPRSLRSLAMTQKSEGLAQFRHSGSDPTAAGGGNREGSEWQRSVGDEGRKTEDIHRAPQQEFGIRHFSRGSTQGAPLHFLPTVSVGAAIGRPPTEGF